MTTTPSVEPSAPEPSVEQTPSTENYSTPEQTTSEPSTVATAETDDGGMSLVKDPVTGKVSLKFGTDTNDTPAQEEAPTEPAEEAVDEGEKGTDSVDMGQQAVSEKPMYNLEEFSTALANGRVDADRVPQEYQAQYADYRIREAIQQRQAQQQAAIQREQAQRQQIAQQMSPEQRVQANKDFYNALEEEANSLALKDLGITQEQLDDAEYADNGEQLKREYQNAKDWHKSRLRGEMQARYQQEQAYKQAQQATYNDISAFVEEQRAKEPNFDAIDKTLATRYKTLPYEQGQVIQQALTALQNGTINQQGVQVIQQYYNDCRKEYYAKKNGLKPNGQAKPVVKKAPPVVEGAGQGQQVERSYKPNYSNLRNAKNSDARKAWFSEYFKNNGW